MCNANNAVEGILAIALLFRRARHDKRQLRVHLHRLRRQSFPQLGLQTRPPLSFFSKVGAAVGDTIQQSIRESM